jgi:hypothetical protein
VKPDCTHTSRHFFPIIIYPLFKKLDPGFEKNSGPHKILEVNTNGTVRLHVGSVTDTVDIRRIEPYKEVSGSILGG